MMDSGSGDGGSLRESIDGTNFEGPAGEYFAVDSVRDRTHRHGRHGFSELLGAKMIRVPVVQGELQAVEVSLDTVAFIDTETTGLGYGVGTQVFMIGVGYVEGEAFRARQFFLREPGEENAVLAAIMSFLARFSTIVSFNGRSFDWPLLENRFIYQRLWSSPLEPAHIDLLFTTRRLWKRRLESCGLSSVEQSILGVRRTGLDVEGWEIPQLYFRYLRTGDARPLQRVFYHNLQDIWSLAMLSLHVHEVLADPWAGAVEHAVDFVSLSRIYDLLHEPETAIRCLNHALAVGLPGRVETEAWLRLALIHKRRGNWDEAVPLFRQVVEREGFERIACVELAKYHEHVARDHDEAMRYTVRAMRSQEFHAVVRWPGIQRLELHHRQGRLHRKLALRAA